jgi:CheY-like chemotaxis protein
MTQALQHRPRVIVLDLMMPMVTGWEFREAQLQHPDISHIPMICITGAARPNVQAASRRPTASPSRLTSIDSSTVFADTVAARTDLGSSTAG